MPFSRFQKKKNLLKLSPKSSLQYQPVCLDPLLSCIGFFSCLFPFDLLASGSSKTAALLQPRVWKFITVFNGLLGNGSFKKIHHRKWRMVRISAHLFDQYIIIVTTFCIVTVYSVLFAEYIKLHKALRPGNKYMKTLSRWFKSFPSYRTSSN